MWSERVACLGLLQHVPAGCVRDHSCTLLRPSSHTQLSCQISRTAGTASHCSCTFGCRHLNAWETAHLGSDLQGFVAFGRKPLAQANCLYALGGGEVVDGSFPEPRVLSTQCNLELRDYFVSSGQILFTTCHCNTWAGYRTLLLLLAGRAIPERCQNSCCSSCSLL